MLLLAQMLVLQSIASRVSPQARTNSCNPANAG
jgi:hypothetical protein